MSSAVVHAAFNPLMSNTLDLLPDNSQESKLLEYVVTHATKGDVTSAIHTIDQHCYAGNWMMNGPFINSK